MTSHARVTRTSPLTNKTRTLVLKVYTPDEFERRLLAYKEGKLLIQDAFPEITPAAREFIKSGITLEEWDDHLDYRI